MARRQGGTLGTFTPLSTPNAPTGLSVSAGIGSISVSFVAPVDTGDAAVTSYIVTTIDESTGASSGTTGSASPIVISPGSGTFKIRAQAVNGFGPGRLTEFSTGHSVFSGAELYSWGDNGSGRLGDGTLIDRSSPVQIGALTNWSQAHSGLTHTIAVKADGTLWGWGSGGSGCLGNNNDTANNASPIQIGLLTEWYQGTAGFNHSGAIKTNGTLWAWGQNYNGRLGLNNSTNYSSPVQVGALTTWSLAASGRDFSFGIKTDGTLWSWGRNYNGQLGHNDSTDRSSPVQIGTSADWYSVVGAQGFTLAIKTTGTLWSWGKNNSGQLGHGDTTYRSSPVQVGALSNWKQVSGNGDANHSMAVKTDGTLWGWGSGNQGQIGQGSGSNIPMQVGALTNWAQVSAGGYAHTIAVKTDGTLWAWGTSPDGALGDNTVIAKFSPIQIGALTNWLKVTSGSAFNVAFAGVV